VRAVAEGAPVANDAFDVTPLVSGLITEWGVLKADRGALAGAFPERSGRPRATPAR
jgi:methylthioribose-1-phosphate isomerase